MSKVTNEENYIKTLAYDTLIELGEYELPILSIKIIKRFLSEGVLHLYKLQSICKTDMDLDHYLESCNGYGFIIYSSEKNRFFAYYNDEMSQKETNWLFTVIAACIMLDIIPADEEISLEDMLSRPDVETFCCYFVAPDTYLDNLKVFTIEEISRYCYIPFKYAVKRKRLYKRYKQRSFISSLERFMKQINLGKIFSTVDD